ncbi:hypothetical protein BDR26DRAFT_893998 [Obelidium mucronatum]|nr:hypothetical protein BDR26DRAFT_893998 [Obelidium mucronatum]
MGSFKFSGLEKPSNIVSRISPEGIGTKLRASGAVSDWTREMPKIFIFSFSITSRSSSATAPTSMAAIPTQATTWVFETQFSELQQVQLDQLRDIMSLPAGSTAAVIFQAIVDDASNADPVAAWDDRFRLNIPLGPEPQLGHPDRADYNAMAALNTSNAVVPVQPPPPGRFAALRGAFPARPQQQQQRQQQQQPRADRADPEDLNANVAADDLSDSDSGQEEDPKGKRPVKKQPQLQVGPTRYTPPPIIFHFLPFLPLP